MRVPESVPETTRTGSTTAYDVRRFGRSEVVKLSSIGIALTSEAYDPTASAKRPHHPVVGGNT